MRNARLIVAGFITLSVCVAQSSFGQTAGSGGQAAQAEQQEGVTAPAEQTGDSSSARDAAMERRVDAEAARIKADPPVHERAEPWAVPIRELDLELQPLRMSQIEERIEAWLVLLQSSVRERNRLLIAADQTDDQALIDALNARATELDAHITSIVNRTKVVLETYRVRGGDVAEQQKYIANATGVKLNFTNPQVLFSQAVTWVRSPSGGIQIGLNILAFIGVLIAFWIASRVVAGLVRAAINKASKNASKLLKDVAVGMVKRVLMIIGLIVAVGQLGVDITPLIAAIGAAGLVIGLALQGTLSNFASGILILINRPYDVGNVISAGGVTGVVSKMSLVSTTIKTFDNQIMYVPNNEIWNGVITNVTGLPTRRVDLVFGIGYADDIAKAEQIINDAITTHPKVLQDPAPTVKVHELADSSVNFVVRPWSTTADYWDVYWDLTRTIKERFDDAGINIPFPQTDFNFTGPVEVMLKNA